MSTSDADERASHGSCPCYHTIPCNKDCTCIKPYSSYGCSRCCSYGGPEQQKARAVYLAALIDGTSVLHREETLLNHIDQVRQCMKSGQDWKFKYDWIFKMGKDKIQPLMKDIGLELDYYDPDTSYEEDVRAYATALERVETYLKAMLNQG